jgi:hypothetical protein
MNFSYVITAYKKANNSIWTEWLFRVFFSIAFIYTVSMTWKGGETFYPDDCFLLILIAIWLYFFKLKLLGFIPLIYNGLFHYWRMP